MTLEEIQALLAKESDPTRLRYLGEALLRHIYSMNRSFRVIELESKIGQDDDVDPREPGDWPGGW